MGEIKKETLHIWEMSMGLFDFGFGIGDFGFKRKAHGA
jgi:hypothetical protein